MNRYTVCNQFNIPMNNEGTEEYQINSTPKGYVLIINMEKFECEKKPERKGSLRDVAELKEMFEDFGYEVIEYKDLNLHDFEQAILEFISMFGLCKVDSAIVFIMSHGSKDEGNAQGIKISTSDNQFVTADWIKSQFSSANCKFLINKPKVIFFQACRGCKKDGGITLDDMYLNGNNSNSVPVVTDLLVVYASLPGFVSQRDTKKGAWFIEELVDVFRNDAFSMDLVTMLCKVDQQLREKSVRVRESFYQVVYYESYGFNKRLYFNPAEKTMPDYPYQIYHQLPCLPMSFL